MSISKQVTFAIECVECQHAREVTDLTRIVDASKHFRALGWATDHGDWLCPKCVYHRTIHDHVVAYSYPCATAEHGHCNGTVDADSRHGERECACPCHESLAVFAEEAS